MLDSSQFGQHKILGPNFPKGITRYNNLINKLSLPIPKVNSIVLKLKESY